MINTETPDDSQDQKSTPNPKPDESSGIFVRGFVKISDPDTGEVIVQTSN